MNPVHVIGTEIGSNMLPETYAALVGRAEVLVGGSLLLDKWSRLCPGARRVDLGGSRGVPLHAAIDTLHNAWKNGLRVVVLADGDPLYFGIGTTLTRSLPLNALRILPGISALQAACSRLGLPWSGITSVSLHGRDDWRPLAVAVRRGQPVCVLGDAAHGPAEVAAWLLDRGANWLRMHVFAGLNTGDERHLELALPEAVKLQLPTDAPVSGDDTAPPADSGPARGEGGSGFFAPTMLLLPEEHGMLPGPSLRLDARLCQTDGGLITKGPVRAAALAALDIHPHDVVWDIGSGSGSVAFSAAALAWAGWVCAVESRPERVDMIRANRRHLAALNLEIVESHAPHGLNMLPDPDAVFVGGGLGDARRAADLLDALVARLRPGGRIVAACVLLGSLERLRAYARSAGIEADIAMIQAGESRSLADDVRMEAHNPVFLISLRKQCMEKNCTVPHCT